MIYLKITLGCHTCY